MAAAHLAPEVSLQNTAGVVATTQERVEMESVLREGSHGDRHQVAPSRAFPGRKREPLPHLKWTTEEEESARKNVWHVYALGAFLIGRWAWARWQRKKRDDEAKPNRRQRGENGGQEH